MTRETTKHAEVERWIVQDVGVATSKESRTEKGLTHPRVPGLAVTLGDHFGEFHVTHLASGKKLAGPYQRASTASEMLAALGYCLDWRAESGALSAALKEHGDEPANAPGWTSTDKDGKRPMTKREIVAMVRDWCRGDEFPWEDESPSTRARKLLAGLPEPLEVVP